MSTPAAQNSEETPRFALAPVGYSSDRRARPLLAILPAFILAVALMLPPEARINISGQTLYSYRVAWLLLTQWVVMEVVSGGSGACGLSAALVVRAAGAEVVVLERDAVPAGSTALSAGLIPAGGSRWQAAEGIDDSAEALAGDILAKSKGAADPAGLHAATAASGPTLHWLSSAHGLPFELLDGFVYPGHRVRRMHGMPERSGASLIDRLRAAAEEAGAVIVTDAKVDTLFMAGDGAAGVGIARPDSEERVGCCALILASNGYGGNRAAVKAHIPELSNALWFGHDGNDGTALAFAKALGADLGDLAGHQGHGSVAHPHGILITWATMTEGGFQVDQSGRRFSDESEGYSEQAARELDCPRG